MTREVEPHPLPENQNRVNSQDRFTWENIKHTAGVVLGAVALLGVVVTANRILDEDSQCIQPSGDVLPVVSPLECYDTVFKGE